MKPDLRFGQLDAQGIYLGAVLLDKCSTGGFYSFGFHQLWIETNCKHFHL